MGLELSFKNIKEKKYTQKCTFFSLNKTAICQQNTVQAALFELTLISPVSTCSATKELLCTGRRPRQPEEDVCLYSPLCGSEKTTEKQGKEQKEMGEAGGAKLGPKQERILRIATLFSSGHSQYREYGHGLDFKI